MNKENKTISARSCEIVSNISSIAERYKCAEEDAFENILKKIENTNCVHQWAGIVHDSDVDENNSPKAKHCHIVVKFKYPVKYEAFSAYIDMPEQTISKIHTMKPHGSKMIADPGGALLYLTHKNSPDKHQYSDELVVASSNWDWMAERDKTENRLKKSNIDDIFEKILDGTITEANLTTYIDPYIFNKNKRSLENMFEFKRNEMQSQHDRNMVVIYIYGLPGTGKTTIAKNFCLKKELTYYITGGSNDPFTNYRGEQAIIIDDARADMFRPEEWLKILDPHTKSDVRSRYHNKIINASYIILTSTVSILHFFEEYPKENPIQLYRRIAMYLTMNKNDISVYVWDDSSLSFTLRSKFPNPLLTIIPTKNVCTVNCDELIKCFKGEPISDDEIIKEKEVIFDAEK